MTTLPRLLAYDEHSQLDESPLYLFDSDFVEKTQKHPRGGLGEDYEVPECFREDFFAVMKDERPDYRWLVRRFPPFHLVFRTEADLQILCG